MSRLIDADDFYKPFEEGKKTLETIGSELPEELLDAVLKIYDEIKEWLDATPTVDAVEVVRCKDCAKREYCRTTNVWATVPDDDWFCADAERRSDDGV